MKLNLTDGFIIYKLPLATDILIRQGEWKNYIDQDNGFIINSFDNSKKHFIESEPCILNENIEIEPPIIEDKGLKINKVDYISQLDKFIKVCNSNLDKVVSSRKIIYNTEKQIDLFMLFKALSVKYDNALIYIYNIPKVGMWIGATPETLIHSEQNVTYTMALAGSQPNRENLVWQKKEIKEHQYVIDDISNKLDAKNIHYHIEKTKTIEAGEVSHLKTIIKLVNKADKIICLADILHPTSAICGMPQQEAKDFILKNEIHDREFYTGYLGEVNPENKSWLFVNLRCMQVFKSSFSIYVGGGIINDSDAEKEWKETELKSRTLLSVIEKM